MYHSGYTFRDIGKNLNRQHSTITKLLRNKGILSNDKVNKFSRISDLKRKEMARKISCSKLNKNPIRKNAETCIVCLSKIGLGKRVVSRLMGVNIAMASNVFVKYKCNNHNRNFVNFKKNTEKSLKAKINSKIARAHKNRIRDFFRSKGLKKNISGRLILGCDMDFFRHHIESQFTTKMNWQNYGKYWHLDHIIPCAKFDLSNQTEILKCFNYNNYRPLNAVINMRDKDRKGIHQQELLMI